MEGRRQKMTIQHRKPERDRVTIVAEILEMARGGVLKTNMMYKAGLSSLMLGRYLGLMMNAKLLEVVLLNNKIMLKSTDRGIKFLYHCHEIVDLLETEEDRNRPFRRIQVLPTSLSS
jgi:predicted transcriptional regulator